MTTAPLSRRERKKLETRLKILEAAFALMAERGYDNVKIEEIAKRADIANATFFLHFPTKSAIVAAFNEQVTVKIEERLSQFEVGAIEKLELVRALILDEWNQHSGLLRRIVAEAAANSGEAFLGSSASLENLIEGIIREGQNNNDFVNEFDAELVAEALVASWRASSLHWAKSGDAIRARRANRQALDMILMGIAPRPKN